MTKKPLKKLSINYFPSVQSLENNIETPEVADGLNLVQVNTNWHMAFFGHHTTVDEPICTLPKRWETCYIVFSWGTSLTADSYGHSITYCILVNGISYDLPSSITEDDGSFSRYGIGVSMDREAYFKVEDNKLYIKGRGIGWDAQVLQVHWR